MSEPYGKVLKSFWTDPDARQLSMTARGLLLCLSSWQPSKCGVSDWNPKRLAKVSAGLTVDIVEGAAEELKAGGYIVIDDDTDEVLVRSYMRNDEIHNNPKLIIRALTDALNIASELIGGVIVHEMKRLRDDYPDRKAWQDERFVTFMKRPGIDVKAMLGDVPAAEWSAELVTPDGYEDTPY